jgi:hypothetical protein
MNGPEEAATLAALARADAFAVEVLTRAAPLRFGVAQAPAELEAVYRLRYRVVVQRGWANPEQFPDGLERDDYDDEAIQIVAWDGAALAGTTRLVLPSPGRPLPAEKAFGLEIKSGGKVLDIGRTCRAPDCNDTGHRVLWGILSQAWLEARARGFGEICGIFTPAVTRLYRSLGFKVEIRGAARQYWGQRRYPVLVRPAESIDSLRRGED